MLCPVCSKTINTDDKMMIGVDRPYVNIWFHKECVRMVDINKFLSENWEMCYNIYRDQQKTKKNVKRRE